jgi:hypothetical protein
MGKKERIAELLQIIAEATAELQEILNTDDEATENTVPPGGGGGTPPGGGTGGG